MPEFNLSFKTKKIVFLDLDGTVYLGNKLLPGAKKFINFLQNQGIFFYFLSNNSSRSKKDYADKISRLGIETKEDRIILSTDGVIDFLLSREVKNTYVIGTRSMQDMFIKAGISTDSLNPKYVILGYDTELTYKKLKTGALHLLNGIELLATHPDFVCPTPEGPIPDVGAMLALFEKAYGKKPGKIFGKPNQEMLSHILKKHNVSSAEIVIIGDRIYTDMELANRLSCDFILVLSGETQPCDLEKLDKLPALVAENIGSIIKLQGNQ